MSTIYILSRWLNPGYGLTTAKQFFAVPEIDAAVAQLGTTGESKLMRRLTRRAAIKLESCGMHLAF